MPRFMLVRLFAAAGVLIVAASAFAQPPSPPAEQEIPTLPPVVVSGTRTERSAEDLPVSATVIPREQIVNSPGRSVEENLRGVAGLQLNPDNSAVIFPLNPSISIRGTGVGDTANRVLVLVDGIPINGGFFGNILWNRVPKETIERVEVVRGASSSLYGSYAMGGVVNIVTRAPTERSGSLSASYGQQNSVGSNLWYSDALPDKKAALSFNGSFYQTDGFFRHDDRPPVEGRESAQLYNFQGRGDWSLTSGVKSFLRVGYNHQSTDGPFQLEQTKSIVTDVATGVDIDAGAIGVFSIRPFYAHENFHVDNVDVPDPTVSFVSNRHHTTSDDFGISGQWSRGFELLNSRVVAGVDFRRVHGTDDQDVFDAPGVFSSTIVGKGTQTSVGVFGELSVKPVRQLEILGNLRFDYFLNSDGEITTNGVRQNVSDSDLKVVSPRIAARYQIVEPLAIRASYYQGFRAPSLAELYRSFETPTFRGLSNPDLKEERLWGGDLGLQYKIWRIWGQVNGFYNEVKDFVGSVEVGDVGGKFTVQAANVAKTRAYGMELITNAQITRDLLFSVNYTLMEATVIEGDLKGNLVEGAPKNAIALSLDYRAPFGLNFNASGRYQSKTFQDISNEASQDARWIFDLYASYQVFKHLQVFFGITNVFDEKYIADGFDQGLGAPRQVFGGLRASF